MAGAIALLLSDPSFARRAVSTTSSSTSSSSSSSSFTSESLSSLHSASSNVTFSTAFTSLDKGIFTTRANSPALIGMERQLESGAQAKSPGTQSTRNLRRASPAALKQALVESAIRHPKSNIFEQGAGELNVTGAFDILATYSARASFLPSELDFTDCPYMWPFCSQPLYFSGQPVGANLTIINGLGAFGTIREVSWVQTTIESSSRKKAHQNEDTLLAVRWDYSPVGLYPWSGYFSVIFEVTAAAAAFEGLVKGVISVTLRASDGFGVTREQVNCVLFY